MRGKKWSSSEKILFLAPLGFVVIANLAHLTPRDRVFRCDVLELKIDGLNPLRVRGSNCNWGRNCGSNLKQIGLAFMQYAQDNDEKFPPVQSGGNFYGWADAIYPYVKSKQIFRCPSALTKPTTTPQNCVYTSFYFNRGLSAQNSGVDNAEKLVLAGEGDDGVDTTDARYSKTSWPSAWQNNPKSPLFRHLSHEIWATRGAYTLFADGHAKLLSPSEFQGGNFTFQVR